MQEPISDADIAPYLSGERLYGDDFSPEEIDAWFADEAEGYYNLTYADNSEYRYAYHALNIHHGYSKLPRRRFSHVLGVGSANGDELAPIASRADRITILEPSEGYTVEQIDATPIRYVKPVPSGEIPVESETLDLVTCLGVLHHIPNVSHVTAEIFRVLKPGGFALIREPITSMGDWRRPRQGLTRRERGIPLNLLRDFIQSVGFQIVRERKCMLSLTSRLKSFIPGPIYDNRVAVVLDSALCALPIWSSRYHARTALEKLRPTAVYFVLAKPLKNMLET